MSVPVFIRKPDGTAWEGQIAYKWSSLRKSKLMLDFGEDIMPPIEDIYQLYGVCPALYISPTQFSNVGKLDPVYRFLYGYSIEELMEIKEKESYSMPGTYINEPQEWTVLKVMSMDWDAFCLAYYTFLCSNNDFKSNAWEALSAILKTLKSNLDILSSLLSNCGRGSGPISCSDFWETIFDGLQLKILDWLHEKTCYTAFHSMVTVRSLFSAEKYKLLENECCGFFDQIARERIDDACKKTYTVRALIDFNIELLFFYKDYFESLCSSEKTKQYVMNTTFTLLYSRGDKVVAGENMLGADAVYEAALKFAQTDSDRELISNKRNKIASAVSVARADQERKQEKERRKDRARDILGKALDIVFLISVATTVLFGLLTLLGISKAFSKTAFLVSLCVMVPFLIIFTIFAIQDRYI